jgi:cullin 3
VLANAIREIENKNASKLSFEELYRKSYNLVLRKHGKQLYDSVSTLVGEHLLEVKDLLNTKLKSNVDTNVFLKEVSSRWTDHLLSMRMVSDVLMYLDRVYAKENHLPLIYDVGINLFRDNVIKIDNNHIGNTLNSFILEQIANSRNGLIVDNSIVKSIITMFESLLEDEKSVEVGENFYLKFFEPYYLDKTLDYYTKISSEIFAAGHGSSYIHKVDELIRNEEDKCILYIPKVTLDKLMSLIGKILVTSNIDRVMRFQNESLKFWILNDKHDELKLLYKLLNRVDYFDGLLEQIEEIITGQGLGLEQEEQDQLEKDGKPKGKQGKKASSLAITWIDKVISLKDKYDLILQSLGNDPRVQKTIDHAFVEFLNKNTKLSEYLSLFVDESIKKSGGKSEQEIETTMDNAIVIFRFIKDKDVFEKYYKNHLAKRLLKSYSDLERTLISKFKNELGSSFTSKLEGMFRDINLSKEVSKNFNHKNFEVNVLTKTFWPIQPQANSQEVLLAPQLEQMKSAFGEYYLKLHSGRNLSWAYNFGSIDIRIKFEKKIHELNMSFYCGLIVLLFEENDELTFDQIEILTKIPKTDLIRSLQSIAVAPRTRILTKKPMSKDIKPTDVFTFNNAFSAPMTKVKVLTVANKIETDSERSKTIEKIDEDRKYELDAAVVRIMKSRKILTHNELIVETVKQITRFKPSPQFIKKRIDALLEREYLQRDEEDRNVYHYLA